MIQFTIKVAECPVQITAIYPCTKRFCKEYLTEEEPECIIEITPDDLDYERKQYTREHGPDSLPRSKGHDALLELTAVQRKLAEELFVRNILVFHGSVVAMDGQGYLFTAVSGTGKSTHTRFWRETFGDRVMMVNDDKPFLRLTDDGVLVYGSPWNGKHRLGNNICVPLKAICILERGQENVIHAISGQEATMMLFQQSNRPMDLRKLPQYMDLIGKLSQKTGFYHMQCNLDRSAALIAYETMSK